MFLDLGCPCGERVGENREPWQGAAPRPAPQPSGALRDRPRRGVEEFRGPLRRGSDWLPDRRACAGLLAAALGGGPAVPACPHGVPLPAALCFALTRSLLLTCLVPAGLLGLRYYYSRKVILAYLDCALHSDMADIEQYYMKPPGESPARRPAAASSRARPPPPQRPQARPGVRAKQGWPRDWATGGSGRELGCSGLAGAGARAGFVTLNRGP